MPDNLTIYPVTPEWVSKAKVFLAEKWKERAQELGKSNPTDMSGACKFISLFGKTIFGLDIQGNWGHQYNITPDGKPLDLAEGFSGEVSYLHDSEFFNNPKHRESMASCMPRVRRWAEEFIQRYPLLDKTASTQTRWSHPLLNGLKAETRKAPTFEDFKHDFSIDIKHGLYFHVTDNPNFTIDPAKGPRDMSSMGGGTPVPGKLMVTSHLENWTDYYESDRAYVAVIDMSEVPRESYHQVSRGFGNEFWVENPQAVKVAAVMPVKEAIKLDRTYQNVLDLHSDEDLLEFYNQFHAPAEPEWKPPKEQGKLPFRGKGIPVVAYEPCDFELLWATWHNKVLLTDDMGLWHVKWFQELNQHSQRHDPIPSWGPEFDKVPRGRAEVNKKKKRVRLYTDAAPKGSRAGESITGEVDFDFTPEEVVAKIKQKYPSLRDFEFVDEVAPRIMGKWAADEFEYPQIAYHVSRRRSRNSILKNGLQMYHKQQYEDVEHEPAVYLFGSLTDAENWVGEQQPYTGQACDIWEVKVPQGEGTFWPDFEVRHEYPTAWKYLWDIPPQNIKLIKTISLPKQAALPTGKAIDDLGISGQQGWSYDEPFPDRHNDFYEDDQVQNPHSERPLTAALSPAYTEEAKELEYEHELISLAEEMGNFERVVWERQPVLKTHMLDTVGLAGSANDYPHLRAVHVGDPDYWFSRLTEDYSRDSKAWVVEIYPTEDDYLCDDVQYAMDPSGGDKAYSAILITPRTQLVEGKDFRYVKELTEEDLPEVYDEDDGFGFKDAAIKKTVIMWVRHEGKLYTTVQVGGKSHAQWLEELSLPFSGPSYDRIERGVAIVDRGHRVVHLVKNAGGYTPNDVVEYIKNRYNLKEFIFVDTESSDTGIVAFKKVASDDAYYDAAEAFFDRESVVAVEVITEYMQHVRQKRYRQQWNVVPAARLIKIWEDYMKTGFVRDSAGLNQIAETVIDNCFKIYVNSILCGHSAMGPEEYALEMLEREGISKKFPEDYFKRAPDYFDTPEGGWRISDQAEGRLMNLVQGVYLAKSDEDKLQALDKVLQFSHPRSDLSSWLVQGGRTTLNRLFTGMNEYERWEQYGGVEEAKELNKEFNKGRNAPLIPKEAWSTEPGGEPLKPETQSTIAEMVADIRKIYPECQRISLAGSAARDELKPKSDIDVVIDFPKGTPAWDMVERDQPLWDKYQQVEGRMVDFIIHVKGGPHAGQYDYREELGLPNPMKTLWEATTKTASFSVEGEGWLTPDGRFLPNAFGEKHEDSALRLGFLTKEEAKKIKNDTQRKEQVIAKGNIRVGFSNTGNTIFFESKTLDADTKNLIGMGLENLPRGVRKVSVSTQDEMYYLWTLQEAQEVFWGNEPMPQNMAYLSVASKTAALPGLGLLQPGHGDDSSAFDPGYYMTEGCGIFAVALARLNRGVVYFMSDPEGDPWHNIGEMSPEQIAELEDSGNLVDWNMTHVYCMAPDGKTYDIKGQRSPAVMAKDFDMDPANPEVSLDGGPYQPDDFMNQFMGEIPESGEGERPLYGNEKDVAEVTQYILKNPRKYGLTRKGC